MLSSLKAKGIIDSAFAISQQNELNHKLAKLRKAKEQLLMGNENDRRHFIKLMNAQGYKVKWEDSRQNITFTTPMGMKCRDRKLGDSSYYCKSNFEMIFEQNSMGNGNTDKLPKTLELMQKISEILQMNPTDDMDFSIPHISFDGLSHEEMEALAHWLKHQIEAKKARNEWEQQSQKLNMAFEHLEELLEMALQFIAQNQYTCDSPLDNQFER